MPSADNVLGRTRATRHSVLSNFVQEVSSSPRGRKLSCHSSVTARSFAWLPSESKSGGSESDQSRVRPMCAKTPRLGHGRWKFKLTDVSCQVTPKALRRVTLGQLVECSATR